MSTIQVRNVSNLAALGAEWTTETGARWQLVNIKGTDSLTFGVLPAGANRWIHGGAVADPERFGFAGPCKNAKELLAIAERFVAKREEDGAHD